MTTLLALSLLGLVMAITSVFLMGWAIWQAFRDSDFDASVILMAYIIGDILMAGVMKLSAFFDALQTAGWQ